MTTTKKLLVGCGLGCGTLVLMAIVTVIGFSVWVSRPGELLEPGRLLGEDTRGYLEWRLALEDPGTEGFAELLIETMQDLPDDLEQSLPPVLSQWLIGRRAREIESDVMQLFPMVAVWALHADEETDGNVHMYSASLKSFGNKLVFTDWILGMVWHRDDDTETHKHNGERIYEFTPSGESKFAFFLRGPNLFFATDVGGARNVVDRVRLPAVERDATDLDRLYERTDRADTLRGAVSNEHGEAERLLRNLWLEDSEALGAEFWRTLHGVSLSGGLRADGSLSGVMEFHGPDAAWATLHAEALTWALRSTFRESEIAPEIGGVAIAERVRIQFRIPDLVDVMAGLFDGEFETEDGKKIRIGF